MSACQDLREAVADLARGQEHAAAAQHVLGCSECAARLEEARAVTAALAALAERDAGRSAPSWLEEQLRARLGRKRPAPMPWARRAELRLALLAALVVVAVAMLLWLRRPATVAAPQQANGSEMEFLPLVYGDPLEGADALHLTRVRMTRSALSALGLEGAPPEGPSVEAEVLVGQDGVARAIRFVDAEGAGGP